MTTNNKKLVTVGIIFALGMIVTCSASHALRHINGFRGTQKQTQAYELQQRNYNKYLNNSNKVYDYYGNYLGRKPKWENNSTETDGYLSPGRYQNGLYDPLYNPHPATIKPPAPLPPSAATAGKVPRQQQYQYYQPHQYYVPSYGGAFNPYTGKKY